MLRRDGHGAKKVRQVAAAQAAHAHVMGWLSATEAHVQQVARSAVLRPLSVRHLCEASLWLAAAVASRQAAPTQEGMEQLQKGTLGLAQAWGQWQQSSGSGCHGAASEFH
jgi:hypothetical protein